MLCRGAVSGCAFLLMNLGQLLMWDATSMCIPGQKIYLLAVPTPYLGPNDQLDHGSLPWPLVYVKGEEQVGVWLCH